MRYSSNMQNYMSIEAQRRAIKKYYEENVYTMAGEYVDEAQSATTDDRKQFQQMMKDIKSADIDAIIVHKFDRFSRNMADALNYECVLQKLGIRLISVTEPTDDSPVSVLLRNIMYSTNDYFSRNLATEVQKGKKEIAYQCKHTGGLPPYGYDVGDDRKYSLNETESKVVKTIFGMYINNYSYQQIADHLNRKGYKTKKGLPFNKNSFSSILENAERYTGTYIYNRASSKYCDGTRNSHRYKNDEEIIKIPDGMPRIISDKVYNAYLEKKAENRGNTGMFHSKRYYLLNGLLYCGVCGKAYSGNTSFAGRNKTEYATYRCGGYRGECNNKTVNIDYLNDYVLTLLTDIIFDEKNYKSIIKALNKRIKKNSKNIKYKKIQLKNKITNIECQILKSDNNDTKTSLESEKAALENEYEYYCSYVLQEVSYDDIENVCKLFRKYLLKKDLPICRKLIHSFVDKIMVYPDYVEAVIKTD